MRDRAPTSMNMGIGTRVTKSVRTAKKNRPEPDLIYKKEHKYSVIDAESKGIIFHDFLVPFFLYADQQVIEPEHLRIDFADALGA